MLDDRVRAFKWAGELCKLGSNCLSAFEQREISNRCTHEGALRLIDLKKIEEMVDGIAKVLPGGVADVRTEIRENIKIVVASSFERMNLVTREEFDAQSALLKRTRAKLDELEKLVTQLED